MSEIRDDFARAWDRQYWRERMSDPAKREAERLRSRLRFKERMADPVYRQKRREAERKRSRTRNAAAREAYDARPFVACDGEGIRIGDRAHYALFRMGSRELYAADRRLETGELLAFITAHPSPEDILVAFAFDYDASNILRDVSRIREQPGQPSRFERLFLGERNYREGKDEHRGWTFLTYGGVTYGVDYLPRNHLKVCVTDLFEVEDQHGIRELKRYAVPGSTRTIYDTFGFFQASFLKALATWEVGSPEVLRSIAESKDARQSFDAITPEIRAYCALECDLLAELMTRFREMCLLAGIRPRTWNGAGKLASSMLAEHNTMKRKELEERFPAALLDMAMKAFYGGRFEVTRIGRVREPGKRVYERDINSAYPAAMLTLPCLEHGSWLKVSRETMNQELALSPKGGPIYVCPVEFQHPKTQFLCGLPFRTKGGTLVWPRYGRGVYWSTEIRSAQRLGATVKATGAGYVFMPGEGCSCKPFAWVADRYAERKRIGKATKGIPIKLGLNSIYGKEAQRVGARTYANPIWAGLITAHVRAQLNDAIGSLADPKDCLMLATDAIYTLRPPSVSLGDGLGEWEAHDYPGLFIVRPGLYWPLPRRADWKAKTRGISRKFFEPLTGKIVRAWDRYCADTDFGPDRFFRQSPSIPIPVRTFIGLRYAYRLNDFDLACQWLEREIKLTFGDRSSGKGGVNAKRATGDGFVGRSMILPSLAVAPGSNVYSVTYDRNGGVADWADEWEEPRLLLEALPEPVDLTPPFRET